MKNKALQLFASAVALILVSGCASTMKVTTQNPALNITKKLTEDPTNHTTVTFEPFKVVSKEQAVENVIGEAKLGMFNSKARIIDSESSGKKIASAVRQGFHDAGFQLVDSHDADYTVGGSVERFWVDEYATGWSMEYSRASVRFDLIIKSRQGAIVWANSLEQFRTSDKSMDTTANDLPTLSLALKGAVEAVFNDPTFWNAFAK